MPADALATLLAGLREKAEKATPGPWASGHNDGTDFIVLPHAGTEGSFGVAPVRTRGDEITQSPCYAGGDDFSPSGTRGYVPQQRAWDNAAYLAACSREVVLGLVAVAEAAVVFARIADMMDPLNLPDEYPLNRCAPRAWVHLSHARKVRDALAALAARETGGAR